MLLNGRGAYPDTPWIRRLGRNGEEGAAYLATKKIQNHSGSWHGMRLRPRPLRSPMPSLLT
jgi:hypothetical protein